MPKPKRLSWQRRDRLVALLRDTAGRFRQKMEAAGTVDPLYFGKTGMGKVLAFDADRLDEILAFMEKRGWAKKTGYRDTYEIS